MALSPVWMNSLGTSLAAGLMIPPLTSLRSVLRGTGMPSKGWKLPLKTLPMSSSLMGILRVSPVNLILTLRSIPLVSPKHWTMAQSLLTSRTEPVTISPLGLRMFTISSKATPLTPSTMRMGPLISLVVL
jgi:hypothetical protein